LEFSPSLAVAGAQNSGKIALIFDARLMKSDIPAVIKKSE
jgi:hypothetical protein